MSTAARVEAWVDPVNEPSQKAMQRNGVVREATAQFGVRGARADVVVYSRQPTVP